MQVHSHLETSNLLRYGGRNSQSDFIVNKISMNDVWWFLNVENLWDPVQENREMIKLWTNMLYGASLEVTLKGKVHASTWQGSCRSSISTTLQTRYHTTIMQRDPRVESAEKQDNKSKSPHRSSRHDRKRNENRSRSPRRGDVGHRHKRKRSRSPTAKPVVLPYKAKPLSKRHYDDYKPLFQSYLDIQKQIHLEELDEREVRGRWKSFVSHWYAY